MLTSMKTVHHFLNKLGTSILTLFVQIPRDAHQKNLTDELAVTSGAQRLDCAVLVAVTSDAQRLVCVVWWLWHLGRPTHTPGDSSRTMTRFNRGEVSDCKH